MNIVGENFPEEIVKQINVRQAKKGAKNRTTENLVWQNANTGWVKMVSSVNINKKDRLKVSNTEMAETILPGNKLAQEYVLFGGVYQQGEKSKDGLSQGIARNGSVLNNSAYGLGGLDLGLKPMPGITSFSIKSENRGSLKTATIGIKCHNRHQFDIINTLYLSLGYSILIEWGNVMYYDNKGDFRNDIDKYSLADEFLDGSAKWNNILDDIRKKRLASCGNYDAALGKVVNFNWTLNRDLSYDVTVTVRTVGDVIESLKMNALSGYIPVDLAQQVTTAFSESGTNDFNKFVLDKAALAKQIYNRLLQNGLNDIKARGVLANILAESSFNPGADTIDTNGLRSGGLVQWNGPRLSAMISSVGSKWKENWQGQIDYIFREKGSKIQQYKNETFATAEDAAYWWARYWEVTARKHWPQRRANVKLFPPGLNLPVANTTSTTNNTNTVVPLKNTPQKTTTPNPFAQTNPAGIKDNVSNNVIIPIQNTTQSPTQGASGTTPSSPETTPETTGVDTTQDVTQPAEAAPVEVINKYAYTHDVGALFYNMMISLNTNPTLTNGSNVDAVKISFTSNGATTDQYYVRLGYFLQQLEENIIYQLKGSEKANPSKIIKFDYDINSNLILLYSRQLSANPNACIFKRKYLLSDGTDITLFPELNDFLLEGSGDKYPSYYGKIMNTYFSMKDILEKMEASKNSDTGVLALIDLLKILTGSFCESTGKYNKLEPTVDEESNTIKFIDSLPLPDVNSILKQKSEATAVFKMFGYYASPKSNVTEAGMVRDLSLTTTVSPNLATMITIGAQSNGYVTGQDSTALSVMNYGLKDRVKPEWVEPTNPNNYPSPPSSPTFIAPLQPQTQTPTTTGFPFQNTPNPTFTNFIQPTTPAQPTQPAQPAAPTLKEKYKDVLDTFSRFTQDMATNTWNQDDVTAFTNSIQSFAEYNQAEETIKIRKDQPLLSSPSIGFLPFDLTLTIDGLSGMKIYQKFVADTEFLPSNYPQSLEFLIKGITHEIKDNQWITRLESLATPKNPFGSKDKFNIGDKTYGQQAPTERAEGAGGPRSSGFSTGPGNSRSVTSGIPIKPTGHRAGNFPKSQIVLHYSAGSQLASAAETINVLNNRSKGGFSYHYIIQANGFVEQMVPDNYKAFHALASGVNSNAIGISLENYGWANDANRSSYGTIPSNQTRAARLVDFYGNPKPYRGKSWAQEITDAQYTALINLIRKIKKNNPGITWPGLTPETFQIMFPAGTSYSASRPGLYSHSSAQLNKLDVLPTPKVVAALKAIGPLAPSRATSSTQYTSPSTSTTSTKAAGAGNNVVIGDSISVGVDKAYTNINGISKPVLLNKSGETAGWLLGQLAKINNPYTNVKNLVLSIGSNNGWSISNNDTLLAQQIKRVFPNATLYILNGNYGWGSLIGNTDWPAQINTYINFYKGKGFNVVGNVSKVTAHPANGDKLFNSFIQQLSRL